MTIMDNTTDKIENQIIILPFLFKVFAMFKMRLCYDNKNIEEHVVDNIGIRCSNCDKTTGLSVKIQIKNTRPLNFF